jgi:hypothetical protein
MISLISSKWSGIKTTAYSQYPKSWRSKDEDYKNKQKRTDALQKLAQKFCWDSKYFKENKKLKVILP